MGFSRSADDRLSLEESQEYQHLLDEMNQLDAGITSSSSAPLVRVPGLGFSGLHGDRIAERTFHDIPPPGRKRSRMDDACSAQKKICD